MHVEVNHTRSSWVMLYVVAFYYGQQDLLNMWLYETSCCYCSYCSSVWC